MDFPIFASHPNGSVWYQILSPDHFIEWKRLGPSKYPQPDNYIRTETKAKDYSMVLYIHDLLQSIAEGELTQVDLDAFPKDLPNGNI
ncbi:MAG: hypothetical protein HKN45_02190 [Flavobacteriales bacterium]|nr:hypothetical protein [Flavobacteriales bacterium]NNK80801.1 hypothetical protein [Flavobacteriales bacterium]